MSSSTNHPTSRNYAAPQERDLSVEKWLMQRRLDLNAESLRLMRASLKLPEDLPYSNLLDGQNSSKPDSAAQESTTTINSFHVPEVLAGISVENRGDNRINNVGVAYPDGARQEFPDSGMLAPDRSAPDLGYFSALSNSEAGGAVVPPEPLTPLEEALAKVDQAFIGAPTPDIPEIASERLSDRQESTITGEQGQVRFPA